jgi:hypothetical protein
MYLADVIAKLRASAPYTGRPVAGVTPSKHRKKLRGGKGTALATGRRPATVKKERRMRRKMRNATRRAQQARR